LCHEYAAAGGAQAAEGVERAEEASVATDDVYDLKGQYEGVWGIWIRIRMTMTLPERTQ